jgi:hypothetical protein
MMENPEGGEIRHDRELRNDPGSPTRQRTDFKTRLKIIEYRQLTSRFDGYARWFEV